MYGQFLPAGMMTPADAYLPYAQLPAVKVVDASDTAAFDPAFTFDQKSVEFANENKATVRYRVLVQRYEMVFQEGNPHYGPLIGNPSSFAVSSGLSAANAFTVTVGAVPVNQRVVVTVWPELILPNADIDPMTGHPAAFRSAPFYQVIGNGVVSPPGPGLWQTIKDIWALVRDLGSQFGEMAGEFFDTLATGEFSNIFTNLTKGLPAAVGAFFDNLDGNVKDAFYRWLGGPDNILADLPNFDVTSGRDIATFLLKMSGLSWDHLQGIMLDELGNGNVAALTDFVTDVLGDNRNLSDPRTMVDFLGEMAGKFSDAEFTLDFDWATIQSALLADVGTQITKAIARAVPQVLAMFVPGAGMVRAIYNGLTWLLDNRTQLNAVFDQITASLSSLSLPPTYTNGVYSSQFKTDVLNAMKAAAPLFISFLASQFGLNKLPDALRKAIGSVPKKIENALRKGLRGFAKKVNGGRR